jgi:hypothetical protein
LNEDYLSLKGHKSNDSIGVDSESCCNNKNNTQNLLGSSTSTKDHTAMSSSLSNKYINFTALE